MMMGTHPFHLSTMHRMGIACARNRRPGEQGIPPPRVMMIEWLEVSDSQTQAPPRSEKRTKTTLQFGENVKVMAETATPFQVPEATVWELLGWGRVVISTPSADIYRTTGGGSKLVSTLQSIFPARVEQT